MFRVLRFDFQKTSRSKTVVLGGVHCFGSGLQPLDLDRLRVALERQLLDLGLELIAFPQPPCNICVHHPTLQYRLRR